MGYIQENLVPGETLVYRTTLHWWTIIDGAVRSLISLAFLAGLFWLFTRFVMPNMGFDLNLNLAELGAQMDLSSDERALFDQATSGVPLLALLCVGISIPLSILIGFLNYISSEFGVTNRRVLIKTGILRRRTLELNLSKIESFQIYETLLGRLFGYKTIVLTGSGGTQQMFSYVANARIFRSKVTELSTSSQDEFEREPREPRKRRPSSSLFDDIDLPSEATEAQLRQAVDLVRAGDRAGAQSIVRALADSDPNNADVWYMAGYLASSPDQKRQAYERALRINPAHSKARDALERL